MAVQPVAVGGLALMSFARSRYKHFFSKAPPVMIDEPPDCTAQFLKWLLPKHKDLAQLTEHDLKSRDLKKIQARDALRTLQSERACMVRHIFFVLLKKSLYLYYYIEKHQTIADNTNFEDLVNKNLNMLKS